MTAVGRAPGADPLLPSPAQAWSSDAYQRGGPRRERGHGAQTPGCISALPSPSSVPKAVAWTVSPKVHMLLFGGELLGR